MGNLKDQTVCILAIKRDIGRVCAGGGVKISENGLFLYLENADGFTRSY